MGNGAPLVRKDGWLAGGPRTPDPASLATGLARNPFLHRSWTRCRPRLGSLIHYLSLGPISLQTTYNVTAVTADELRKLYPRASESFIRRNASDYVGDSGNRPSSFVQKQQANPEETRRDTVHRQRRSKQGLDAKVHPTYRLTVDLRYSDNRPRDIDGSLSTILDCLVTAAAGLRRLTPVDPRNHHPLPPSSQGPGGGDSND